MRRSKLIYVLLPIALVAVTVGMVATAAVERRAPLLVGGQVIGSVLMEHEPDLEEQSDGASPRRSPRPRPSWRNLRNSWSPSAARRPMC